MDLKNLHELSTFNPGRDQDQHSTNWTNWYELWELCLQAYGWEEKEAGGDYKEAKRLKPLFIIKLGEEARKVYNSKRSQAKDDKLVDIVKFMSEYYAPKRSKFAYVAIFCRAKRHEGESVNDYILRLRHLATPCEFGTTLDSELLRAFVFGCGIEKVEELACKEDKDAPGRHNVWSPA